MLWCFSLCAPAAVAATSLSGNLTDPQGRVVAGARVRLLRRADSSRRETQTDSQGQPTMAWDMSGAICPQLTEVRIHIREIMRFCTPLNMVAMTS